MPDVLPGASRGSVSGSRTKKLTDPYSSRLTFGSPDSGASRAGSGQHQAQRRVSSMQISVHLAGSDGVQF